MKVFISYDGLCESFNIQPDQTVKDAKQMIKDCFHIQLSDDKQRRRFLELTYAGAVLRDEWVLSDAGITVCCTIKCLVKEEEKPAFYVYNAVTQEKILIMGSNHLLEETVSKLKTLVSQKCGFPVSVFCLKTLDGKEMYDCNSVSDYKLDLGATLRMDVWDGWKEFLSACITGHKQNVRHYLSRNKIISRYQQKVALYIAAYRGHLELAEWLTQKGVRADETIGVHPYREWCCETGHPDIGKCAIHAAAEAGQLLLIKAFVAHNVLCLDRQTPLHQTPLKICIQHGHKDCVLYLIMKMWSVVSFPKIHLPISVYIKVKKWLFKAQKKVYKAKWAPEYKTRAGDTVVVDGFTEPTMASRSLHDIYQDKWKTVVKKSGSHRKTAKTSSFPSLNKSAANPLKTRKVGLDTKDNNDILKNTQISLPPISNTSNSRPRQLTTPHTACLLNSSLESYTKHTGRTPRQNAIYCLTLASEFKEKTWLRQLDIARMLAKKTVYSL